MRRARRRLSVCAENYWRASRGRTRRIAGRKEDNIITPENHSQGRDGGDRAGKLFVVGIGPGSPLDRTRRASEAILASDSIVGYRSYIDLIPDLLGSRHVISSAMLQECDRCRQALELAMAGHVVALISSGDPGVYGMAGLAMEMAHEMRATVDIEVVPGVSAAGCAAARLGAPLMLDFATISLSDLLTPWPQIIARLEAVAACGMAAALYNPRSHKRVMHLEMAAQIFLRHRAPNTPVGVATSLGMAAERIEYSSLDTFLSLGIGMRSIVLIGAESTKMIDGRMVTPRGYKL